jgi:hypothetical protein
VEDAQPLGGAEFLAVGANVGQMGMDVIDNACEEGPCFVNILFVHRDSDIPLLHNAVGGAGHFAHEHTVILTAVLVQPVAAMLRNQDGPFKVDLVDTLIVDGDLGCRTRIERVEQLAVTRNISVLSSFEAYSINVRKADALGNLFPT